MIYLAGPISGTAYKDSVGWREWVEQELWPTPCLNPMRGKSYLSSEQAIEDSYDTPLSCSRGIITRDRWDVMRCDLVLANFLGAEIVSIGSVIEIAWADAYRKPLILVMEEGNLHNHAMIREIAGFWLPDLESAVDIIQSLLGY